MNNQSVATGPADERIERVARNWRRDDLELMMRRSPLVEVTFDQAA